MDGGLGVLDEVERLMAAWDGEPAREFGGVADVIAPAHKPQLALTVIGRRAGNADRRSAQNG